MAAPKAFSLNRPVVATEIPAKRDSGRDYGPNLFLQADPEGGMPDGWFMFSYNTGQWMDVAPVSGDIVVETIAAKDGKPAREVEKLTGELKEVTRQLREAANTLNMGVAIKYFPMVYKSGPKKDQEIPGKWLVKYLAGKRKQRRATETTTEDAS